MAACFLIALGALGHAETGKASFYGGPRHNGHLMAGGGIYNQNSNTCAHKTMPFGTRLRVVRASGGSVVCVVRDRGPYKRGRIVDLSLAHAKALGMIDAGVVQVTVERVR